MFERLSANVHFQHAPARQALFDCQKELMHRLPKVHTDRATHVLAIPGRADRGTMLPDAAASSLVRQVMGATQAATAAEERIGAGSIEQLEVRRLTQAQRRDIDTQMQTLF